jgi:hypothetical protein
VKSDKMSCASGSMSSSSKAISLMVLGDVGIVGNAIEEAEALTNG